MSLETSSLEVGMERLSLSSSSAIRGLNNPLTYKIVDVLSSSYSDAEFRDSLAFLVKHNVKNDPETRRRLRFNIQKDIIERNGEIIDEFGCVADQLRQISTTIQMLTTTYDSIKVNVAAHSTTNPNLAEACSLIDRYRNVEIRRRLLHAFISYFFLTEDEIASLTLMAEPLNSQFFVVLDRTKKIEKDCEIVLGFEDNPSLGLEIMEQTSKHIELGYQKLYKWLLREFKHLNLENPQISSSMSYAVRVLAERPALFQNSLETFSETRESILSDAFYIALTGNSESSSVMPLSSKPIELVAHDPLRYLGDMLAWTHSTAVSEREALEALLTGDNGERSRGIKETCETEVQRLVKHDSVRDANTFDPIIAVNNLVTRNMSGVTRILRQRIAQVIQVNEDTILAYKLVNLINFYRHIFSKLLPNCTRSAVHVMTTSREGKPDIVGTFQHLESEALRQFRLLVRDHIAIFQNEFALVPVNLDPPDFLYDALKQLVSIMKTYDTSLTPPENRATSFAPILEDTLDPFLAGCKSISKQLSKSQDSLIYYINCLETAKETLSLYEFTASRCTSLETEINSKLQALQQCQYTFFRKKSGLSELFDALNSLDVENIDDVQRALDLNVLQHQTLLEASQCLDSFLPTALVDAVDTIQSLQNREYARQATDKAAERFCADFEHIEAILNAADHFLCIKHRRRDASVTLRSMFPRTSAEIRVLLS